MSEEIFRKKSLDKVKSPENLDEYIRVSNPGVWLLLVSIIVLLAGAFVWGVFGQIESSAEASVQVKNGVAVCYIGEGDASSIQNGMAVKFGGFEAVISDVSKEGDNYVCTLLCEQKVPEGIYDGKVITETVKPITFVLN